MPFLKMTKEIFEMIIYTIGITFFIIIITWAVIKIIKSLK